MRKEILWIIIIGIVFGLIIAFGVFRINSKMGKANGNNNSSQTQNKSQDNGSSEFKIALAKPENEDVVVEDSVSVEGLTKSLSFVVVSGEEDDYITQADEKGQFEAEVDLTAGVNQIRIFAFDPSGKDSNEKVLVVYSSAFEKKESAQEKESTPSAESDIRKKVQAKVEEVLNKPKAYLGTVTDITEGSIQIKSDSSEIKQISALEESITVINSKQKNKEVKLSDIAIGDYIVAMGYPTSISGNGASQVLSAQRILITDPVEDPGIVSNITKVEAKTAKDMDIKVLGSGETEKIIWNKNTGFYSFDKGKVSAIKHTDIEIDNLIITISATDAKGVKFPRSIFLLTQS